MLFALPFPAFLDPVAFEIGPVAIRWYALAYMLAFLFCWRYCMVLAARNPWKPNAEAFEEFLTWGVIGTILGGRLGYILFYQPEMLQNPAEALALWNGGMAFHGGAIGVSIAIALYCRINKINPLAFGDIVACAVPVGLFFGRLANFVNNELWGRPSNMPWAVVFPIPDHLEAYVPEVPRHPSQLYEAGLEGIILFTVLNLLMWKTELCQRHGALTGVFIAGYGISRFIVEFFREPDVGVSLLGDYLSRGQVLSLPMILIGLGLIVFARKTSSAEIRHG